MLYQFRCYDSVGILLMIICNVFAGISLESNCSITASGDQHSPWFPILLEGLDFNAWQVYTTTGNASDLAVEWFRAPSPLQCTVYSNPTVIVNPHTINVTITINNTRADRTCSDEGFYQIIVTSNCGSNSTVKFHLNFVGPCTLTLPDPAESKMVVVAEPRPGDSTTFCTTMRYFGSSNNNRFYTEWHLGSEICSNRQLCTDDGNDDGDCEHGCFTCSRTDVWNCTFLSKFCIHDYSKLQSGNYTTDACPVISGSGSGSNTSTLDLRILGWPQLTWWPGSAVTSALYGDGTWLTYKLSNFSLEFLNLTFYKSSELINVSTGGYKMDVICDDVKCEMATVRWQVPAEGLYHMCYSFSSVVQHNGSSLNCTEVTRVVANELLVEILVPVAILVALLIVVCVICVCIKSWRKKKETCTHTSEDLCIRQDERSHLLPEGKKDYRSSGSSSTSPDLKELHEASDIGDGDPSLAIGSPPKLKLPSSSDVSGGKSQKDAPGHGRAAEVKVFLLSPYNPNEYVHILPPDELQQNPEQHPELLREYELEVEESKARMEGEIDEHHRLMTRLAHCLEARGITVTGVHQLRDSPVSNIVQWADEQIKNSNFVILIITPSFSKFLENLPPPEKEHLFGATGGYVSRLLHHPPEGLTFLPVFLNQFEDIKLLPIVLRGRPLYQIFEPFEMSLEQLYSVLTKPV